MKTAVEWLVDKHFGGIENCTPDFKRHIEQAIEMEKQQIIDAHLDGQCFSTTIEEIDYAKDYYNETLKNK